MSTTMSKMRPSKHCTYFACPGGTSAKWIPRTVPFLDTEIFICLRSKEWPVASVKADSLNDSRNTPRSSARSIGVKIHTPSIAPGVTSTP